MWRNSLLFGAALLLGLTAGRSFWVSLGESPSNLSAATYVEYFQSVDRRIAVPIAVAGIGGTLLAGLSAVAHRRDRKAAILLSAACILGAVGSLITVSVNVPINEQIALWNPSALPEGYEGLLRRWWTWHQARLAVLIGGVSLVYVAMLVRK
jgi:uncharacterized membrane protein